jgi:hypothetical protein
MRTVLTLVTVAAMHNTPEAPRAAPGARIRYADILKIGRAVRVDVAALVEGGLLPRRCRTSGVVGGGLEVF